MHEDERALADRRLGGPSPLTRSRHARPSRSAASIGRLAFPAALIVSLYERGLCCVTLLRLHRAPEAGQPSR